MFKNSMDLGKRCICNCETTKYNAEGYCNMNIFALYTTLTLFQIKSAQSTKQAALLAQRHSTDEFDSFEQSYGQLLMNGK